MDCVQYAGHLDLSELNARIVGVCGPFRGVVWARGNFLGRYTRVWLDNGYGVLVCERYDDRGEIRPGPLMLVPIRHIDGYGETMWTPVYRTGGEIGERDELFRVSASDVGAGVKLLADLSELNGHDMRAVLR